MAFRYMDVFALVAISGIIRASVLDEKQCSKFDYEYRVLERIIFLENRNADLERKQTVLDRKNEELGEIMKEQMLEVEHKETENDEKLAKLETDYKARFDVLDRSLRYMNTTQIETQKTMEKEIEDWSKAHDEHKAEIRRELEESNKEHSDARKQLQVSLTEEIQKIATRISSAPTNRSCAFTATHSGSKKYNSIDTIIFDSIVTNVGNAYSASTGKFTAPFQGLYAFSISVVAYKSHINAYLMKNSGWAVRVIPDSYNDSGRYDTASITAAIVLEKGDTVWVKFSSGSTRWATNHFYGSDYSTFAGFYIN